MRIRDAVSIADLRMLASRRTPKFVFQPVEEGTESGRGQRANVDAFARRVLVPRVAEEPVTADLSTTVFGRRYAAPFGISAIGYAGKMWPGADRALAEAAVAADLPFMLSMGTVADIESITRLAPGRVWQQLYAARDTRITDEFIGRARDCGVDVLVHTVDMPVSPAPDYVSRTGIRPPLPLPLARLPGIAWECLTHPAWTMAMARVGRVPRLEGWARYVGQRASARDVLKFVGSQMISGAGWREVERIRRAWPGKLVVKGLLCGADVARAHAVGADAVTISNHGGNKLDAAIASLDSLDAIVGAMAEAERPLLFFDGGIRRGSDAAIAHASGAAFNFVGRAALYGMLAGGSAGALKAIELLKGELARSLLHLGVASVDQVGPSHVRPTHSSDRP